MDEIAAKQKIYDSLSAFQETIRHYRREFKKPVDFLVGGASPPIPQSLLDGCRVLSKRDDILADVRKGGVGVEVGTQTGAFAKKILNICQPSKLYLLDLDYTPFRREMFENELQCGLLEPMEGVSWELLESFDDHFFDFAYIDAGHSYDMVKKDLISSLKKVKIGGLIMCNDFVNWSPLEATSYGVHRAVAETIVEHQLSVSHFAFHPFGFNDIAFVNSFEI